jgi:hypothetical protein
VTTGLPPADEAGTAARDDVTTPGDGAAPEVESADDLGSPGQPVRSAGRRVPWRAVASWTLTVLAALFVLAALLLPNNLLRQTPWVFARLPVEPLIGAGLLLALRPRARRWAAVAAGAGLGVVLILKITDIGFYASLARPFNLVLDWILLDDAMSFLQDSIGDAGGIAVAVGVCLLAAGLVALATLAVLRLTRLVVQHDTVATRTLLVLGVAWVALFAVGAQIEPGLPVATRNTISLLHAREDQVRVSLRDRAEFEKQAKIDAFRNVPGDQLLTELRGKDFMLTFIESYGRNAVQDPRLAPVVAPVLDAGTQRLKAAGFQARSGFLTSPTSGGGSWLAHSTLLSGLWIDNQQRYRTLLSSDRMTLPRFFGRADWRTTEFEPATVKPFPEVAFYGYNQVYNFRDLGYAGPQFSWSTMPDQFALSAFQRLEYAKAGRGPMMSTVVLTSSHSPWAPLPKMVGWDDLGDGRVFGPIKDAEPTPTEVWKSGDKVRANYARSIAYSLESLISYVEKYGNDNLVLVFLGDHQPAPLVTGGSPNRDVPITIVARDQRVLDQISGWGWQDGLRPGPGAPVWRMDTFRDKFLTTFRGAPAKPAGTAASPPPRR